MKFEYLLVTLLLGFLPLCFSCGSSGGNGGHGGHGNGRNTNGGNGGNGGNGWVFGGGGHGGNGGRGGPGGSHGKGGKGGKGGWLGKDGRDGRDGKKRREVERLLQSLSNDSSFAKRNLIPKFNIVKEMRDGKITREEFTNILKRPDLEKIVFWKLDANSDDTITCQELEARKLLHIIEGC